VGVDEPVCSGEAAAERLPPLLLGTRRPFPSLLFALEAAESSPGICQERSPVLHFWRGGLPGEGGVCGKVLVNLAISPLTAVPWLVKASLGLLPRGLFALEDALRFSDACWAETQQCPAWRRGQCVYT